MRFLYDAIQSKVGQSIYDYIRDASDDPTKDDVIEQFNGKIAPDMVKETLEQLRTNDMLVLHRDGSYSLNNPDFDQTKHDWGVLD